MPIYRKHEGYRNTLYSPVQQRVKFKPQQTLKDKQPNSLNKSI